MFLASLVPAMFSYGLLGVVFTYNWAFAPAVVLFVFYGIAAFAQHRQLFASADALFHLTTVQAMAVLAGTICGAAFLAAFRLPRLVDLRVFYGWDTKRHGAPPRNLWDTAIYPWPALLVFGAVLLVHGVYFSLGGLWRDIGAAGHAQHAVFTKAQSLSVGLPMAIAGAGCVLIAVLQTAQKTAPSGAPGRLTIKYGAVMLLLAIVPQAVYDWLDNDDADGNGGAALQGAGTFAALAVVYGALLRHQGTAMPRADPYFSGKNATRGRPVIVTLFCVHTAGYATAWAADYYTHGDAAIVLAAIAAVALLMAGALLLAPASLASSPSSPAAAAAASASQQHRRAQPPHAAGNRQSGGNVAAKYKAVFDDDSSESGSGAYGIPDAASVLRSGGYNNARYLLS